MTSNPRVLWRCAIIRKGARCFHGVSELQGTAHSSTVTKERGGCPGWIDTLCVCAHVSWVSTTLLQLNPGGWIDAAALRARLPTIRLPLGQILDEEQTILQGLAKPLTPVQFMKLFLPPPSHVLLGFDREGDHVISYSCRVDAGAEFPTNSYSLHWWRFEPWHHTHTSAYITVALACPTLPSLTPSHYLSSHPHTVTPHTALPYIVPLSHTLTLSPLTLSPLTPSRYLSSYPHTVIPSSHPHTTCACPHRFELHQPLRAVASYPLFHGELTSDLHLVVCQPPASRDMVVLGCR